MLNSIWEDAKREFRTGTMITRLIIINVAVFIFVNLIKVGMSIAMAGDHHEAFWDFLHLFCMSSGFKYLLLHPWGIITSMFLHEGFMHIVWNMLLLYWFGRILGDLLGNRHILPIYLLGGLAGGLAFFITANLLHYSGGFALGASGAVMAVIVAAAVTSPNYIIHLLFLGPVKLKYIAAVMVFLDLIAIADNINTGGHFAHIGGALMGGFFVYQLRNGTNWGTPVNKVVHGLENFFKNLIKSFKSRPKPKIVHKSPQAGSRKSDNERSSRSPSDQARLDKILDKIKESGYENLTAEEKEFLFRASKDD